jgi:hypothetical protein
MTGTNCDFFTHKSVPVIFEPPCIFSSPCLHGVDRKSRLAFTFKRVRACVRADRLVKCTAIE